MSYFSSKIFFWNFDLQVIGKIVLSLIFVRKLSVTPNTCYTSNTWTLLSRITIWLRILSASRFCTISCSTLILLVVKTFTSIRSFSSQGDDSLIVCYYTNLVGYYVNINFRHLQSSPYPRFPDPNQLDTVPPADTIAAGSFLNYSEKCWWTSFRTSAAHRIHRHC